MRDNLSWGTFSNNTREGGRFLESDQNNGVDRFSKDLFGGEW
jgi:hypothetical protein